MFNSVAPTQILFVTTAALDQLQLPAAVYKRVIAENAQSLKLVSNTRCAF